MSQKSWISGAPEIAQVITITVGGTPANGQIYTVAMGINNTKTVSYTATGADTNTTIATSLQVLLANSSYPEFLEETWANPSAATITATAITPGVAFKLTASATGTGTLTATTTTANSGPNDAAVAANYSTNTLPVNADDLSISNTSQGIFYNLDTLSGVVLNSRTWDSTFTGNCGLPATNPNGYEEYRPRFWQLASATDTFLPGTGGGSSLIALDNGSNAWAVQVSATGTPATQGRPALFLKGSNAGNVLTATRGYVGSAVDPGETAVWLTINTGNKASPQTDVNLTLGSGCTVGTINQNAGKLSVYSSVTTWTQRGGIANFYSSATVTTLDVQVGTFYYQSSGTAATVTCGINGVIDCRLDPRGRTFTTSTFYGDFADPNKTVTFTNPASFPIGVSTNTDLGTEIHLQRS